MSSLYAAGKATTSTKIHEIHQSMSKVFVIHEHVSMKNDGKRLRWQVAF